MLPAWLEPQTTRMVVLSIAICANYSKRQFSCSCFLYMRRELQIVRNLWHYLWKAVKPQISYKLDTKENQLWKHSVKSVVLCRVNSVNPLNPRDQARCRTLPRATTGWPRDFAPSGLRPSGAKSLGQPVVALGIVRQRRLFPRVEWVYL